MSHEPNTVYMESQREEVIMWNYGRIQARAKALGKKVSELDAGDLGASLCKCVECFEDNITGPNIIFCGTDPEKIKCYKCQKINK